MSSLAAPAAGAKSIEKPDISLRHCLGHFATGVAIATYDTPDSARGLTVNSFTSVSLDPPLVLVCLDKRSRAISDLPRQPFGVNMLHSSQRELAWHFAGRPSPTLQPIWRRVGQVPLLSESLAWLVCEPWSNHEAGDHVIVVGRVMEFGVSDKDPLCFFRGELVDLL
jgi:flavin reductase (DIM6/NTAB) family NADH-FMN oxidoreductase RutF